MHYAEAKRERQQELSPRSIRGSQPRCRATRLSDFDGARSESCHLTSDPVRDRLRLLHDGWIPVDQE